MRWAGRRSRRVVSAAILTGLISAALIGVLLFARWHRRQALRGDVAAALELSAKELTRSLTSRRGTLTFLRDALSRSPDLAPAQRRALGASAVAHTRHLIAVGLLERSAGLVWWHAPRTPSAADQRGLPDAIRRRGGLLGTWRVPSTFMVPDPDAPLLVMAEPVPRAAAQVLLGVFDARPLAEDFVTSAVGLSHPVQLLEGDTVLFRAPGWRTPSPTDQPIVVGRSVSLDATRWTLQMQPGPTGMARALSWFHVLLVGLSAAAGVGLLLTIWLLAARAWLLQRAVVRRTSALRRTLKRVRQLAVTDELTGLYNRRFFLDRWGWECDRAKRYGRPLACLLIDVNGFKQVNDALGHDVGDRVLRDVARELRALLRQSDILARFGGDEFIIGLPETTPDQARLVADKLRQLRLCVASDPAQTLTVSLSVGLGQVERPDQTPQDVIKAADTSLYASKTRRASPARAPRAGGPAATLHA